MLQMNEPYEIDENGLIRKDAGDGRSSVLGRIVTESGEAIQQFAPFDTAERDLIRVSTAVLNVDRRSLRQKLGVRDEAREASRQRTLALRIPVENPKRWSQAAPVLVELLRFMTDDRWSFEFLQANHVPAQQLPLFPEPVARDTEFALFSGGLDSVAGLWAQHCGGRRRFVAATIYSDRVKLSLRRDAVQKLRAFGADVRLVQFEHHFTPALARPTDVAVHDQTPESPEHKIKEEKSQRSRGFVFFSIGAAMASALRLESVSTYEAGIGALNVPANDAQIGAQNTRAMHPWTLDRLENLFRIVLDTPLRISAPFLFHTKGEVCQLAGPVLNDLVKVAMSCDEGEGHKKVRMLHCGICTSCLLRRSAIHAALGDNDPTPYRNHATRAHGDYDVRIFAMQAARFRDASVAYRRLLELDPDIRRAVRYHVNRGIPEQEVEERIRDLFARQALEAENFLQSSHFPVVPLPYAMTEAQR